MATATGSLRSDSSVGLAKKTARLEADLGAFSASLATSDEMKAGAPRSFGVPTTRGNSSERACSEEESWALSKSRRSSDSTPGKTECVIVSMSVSERPRNGVDARLCGVVVCEASAERNSVDGGSAMRWSSTDSAVGELFYRYQLFIPLIFACFGLQSVRDVWTNSVTAYDFFWPEPGQKKVRTL